MNHVLTINNYMKPIAIASVDVFLIPLRKIYEVIQEGKIKSANYRVAEQLHRVEYRNCSFSAVLDAVTKRELSSLQK